MSPEHLPALCLRVTWDPGTPTCHSLPVAGKANGTPLPCIRGQAPKAVLLKRPGFQTAPRQGSSARSPSSRGALVDPGGRNECPGRRLCLLRAPAQTSSRPKPPATRATATCLLVDQTYLDRQAQERMAQPRHYADPFLVED